MAFVFTVETGAGLTNSNSYATVAEADDYFDIDRVFEATWDAFTTEEKEDRLAWATRALENKVTWKGVKYTETQALAWPRSNTFDRHGYEIDIDEIPIQLKHATFEMAKYLSTNDVTVGRGVDYTKFIKLDVLEIEYMEGTSQSSFPDMINAILKGIGYYQVPGLMSFANISKT